MKTILRRAALAVALVALPAVARAHTWVLADGFSLKCELAATALPNEPTPLAAYQNEKQAGISPSIHILGRSHGKPMIVGVTMTLANGKSASLIYFRYKNGIGFKACRAYLSTYDRNGLN